MMMPDMHGVYLVQCVVRQAHHTGHPRTDVVPCVSAQPAPRQGCADGVYSPQLLLVGHGSAAPAVQKRPHARRHISRGWSDTCSTIELQPTLYYTCSSSAILQLLEHLLKQPACPPKQVHYEDFMTNFTNAARSFIKFVNASNADDEAKLLKSMEACQDKIKGHGRRMLSEQVMLPIDKAPLRVRVSDFIASCRNVFVCCIVTACTGGATRIWRGG